MAHPNPECEQEKVRLIFPTVLNVEGGETPSEVKPLLASRDQRLLTGVLVLGFLGYIFWGLQGAVIGAIVGGFLGYFWRR